MWRLILVAMVAGLIASRAAHANVDDVARVKRLLQMCNQPVAVKTPAQGIDAAICLGYVSGILETFDMLKRICVPRLVLSVDPTEPIVQYLNKHSEMQEWVAPIAILTAAEKIYPCEKH